MLRRKTIDMSCMPCCIQCCKFCTKCGTKLKVTFTQNLNQNGTGLCCADFIRSFTLPILTQTQINHAMATWPHTYGLAIGGSGVLFPSCTFGLFTGLPCGATSIVGAITSSTLAVGAPLAIIITVGWADGTWSKLSAGLAVLTPCDCVSYIQGNTWVSAGIGNGGNPPCDFIKFALGQSSGMSLSLS